MPIKGSVRIKYVQRLKNLEVGTSGYIDSEDIEIVEEKDGTFSLHVDIYTYIYSKEEILDEEDGEDDDEPPPNPFADYVPVKRVGAGLTEKDFILNFKQFIIGPKMGINLSVGGICLGSEFGVYTDFEKISPRFIPFIGIGGNGAKLFVSFPIKFSNSDFVPINKLNVVITFPIYNLNKKMFEIINKN